MHKTQYFSISDLRKNTTSICREISKNKEDAIILNHNRPEFVLMTFEEYKKIRNEIIEDFQDLALVTEREKEEFVPYKKAAKKWKKNGKL